MKKNKQCIMVSVFAISAMLLLSCDKEKDSLLDPGFYVELANNYAYVGDQVSFKFTQVLENGKVVDHTSTNAIQKSSTFSIKGKPMSTSSIQGAGSLTLTQQITATEDSLAICVTYNDGDTVGTAFSKEFRVYNNPSVSLKTYKSGALSILLSGNSKHLWVDDCSIVDAEGNDYTKQIHYDSSHDYVLDIKPNMWGKTYTFYYGPEKRTATIASPNKSN